MHRPQTQATLRVPVLYSSAIVAGQRFSFGGLTL